jgi:hypothetical protein
MQEKITPKMYRHTHRAQFSRENRRNRILWPFFAADLSFKLGEETQTLETTVRVK